MPPACSAEFTDGPRTSKRPPASGTCSHPNILSNVGSYRPQTQKPTHPARAGSIAQMCPTKYPFGNCSRPSTVYPRGTTATARSSASCTSSDGPSANASRDACRRAPANGRTNRSSTAFVASCSAAGDGPTLELERTFEHPICLARRQRATGLEARSVVSLGQIWRAKEFNLLNRARLAAVERSLSHGIRLRNWRSYKSSSR
jgi:hypothetical protein